MKVKLTMDREQYENLLRLAYLGNWMINGIRTGGEQDEFIEAYNQLLQFLLARAYEAGMDDIVEYSEEYGKWLPTGAFTEETEIAEYIDEYNDDNFWEELVYRLAERDFTTRYGEETARAMSLDEYIEKRHPFLEKYEEEVTQNGIENLYLISPDTAERMEH